MRLILQSCHPIEGDIMHCGIVGKSPVYNRMQADFLDIKLYKMSLYYEYNLKLSYVASFNKEYNIPFGFNIKDF